MSREDLDAAAEGLGLDPANYSKKSEEITAIIEVQESSVAESPGFAGADVGPAKAGPPVLEPDEHFLLTGESWVILGADPSVPDWAVGAPAHVASAPVSWSGGDDSYPFTDPNATVTVRERSQGATFDVPLQSVHKLSVAGGRANVVNHP